MVRVKGSLRIGIAVKEGRANPAEIQACKALDKISELWALVIAVNWTLGGECTHGRDCERVNDTCPVSHHFSAVKQRRSSQPCDMRRTRCLLYRDVFLYAW